MLSLIILLYVKIVSSLKKPFEFQVAVVHGQFIVALEALFENHKRDLGFQDTTLEVF